MKKTLSMKNIFCFIILFFGLFFSLLSQTKAIKDTIYLDENNLEISIKEFHKKVNSAVFYSRIYYTDGIVINKILFQYYFGKITSKNMIKIKNILNSISNQNIAKDENILIQYFDTLQDYNRMDRSLQNHFKNYHYELIVYDTIVLNHTILPKKSYEKSYEKNIKKYHKKLSKCSIKLEEKKNTKVFEMYNVDNGYPFGLEKLNWVKDPGLFKNNFFFNVYENNLLIIKPNGDFFMKYSHIKDNDLFNLLKTDDWTQFMLDWEKSIKTNSSVGYGIIKSFSSIYNGRHPDHCY